MNTGINLYGRKKVDPDAAPPRLYRLEASALYKGNGDTGAVIPEDGLLLDESSLPELLSSMRIIDWNYRKLVTDVFTDILIHGFEQEAVDAAVHAGWWAGQSEFLLNLRKSSSQRRGEHDELQDLIDDKKISREAAAAKAEEIDYAYEIRQTDYWKAMTIRRFNILVGLFTGTISLEKESDESQEGQEERAQQAR